MSYTEQIEEQQMDKVCINFCGFDELLTIPSVGRATAYRIWELRKQGDITPEILSTIPYVRMPVLLEHVDFSTLSDVEFQEVEDDLEEFEEKCRMTDEFDSDEEEETVPYSMPTTIETRTKDVMNLLPPSSFQAKESMAANISKPKLDPVYRRILDHQYHLAVSSATNPFDTVRHEPEPGKMEFQDKTVHDIRVPVKMENIHLKEADIELSEANPRPAQKSEPSGYPRDIGKANGHDMKKVVYEVPKQGQSVMFDPRITSTGVPKKQRKVKQTVLRPVAPPHDMHTPVSLPAKSGIMPRQTNVRPSITSQYQPIYQTPVQGNFHRPQTSTQVIPTSTAVPRSPNFVSQVTPSQTVWATQTPNMVGYQTGSAQPYHAVMATGGQPSYNMGNLQSGLAPNVPIQAPTMSVNQPVNAGGTSSQPQPGSQKSSQPFMSLKSLKFDGSDKGDDWVSFFGKFEMYAEMANLTDLEKRAHLCWVMTGSAARFCLAKVRRDKNISYADLVKCMEKRFNLRKLTETVRIQFQSACQAPGEDLDEWAERLLSLADKAFLDLPEDYVINEVVNKLCLGCTDKKAGMVASSFRPKTVDEALERIKWQQYNDKAMYGPGVRTRDNRDRSIPNDDSDSESVIVNNVSSDTSELMKCMDKLSANVNQNMKIIQTDLGQVQDKWDKNIQSVKSEMKGLENKVWGELKAIKENMGATANPNTNQDTRQFGYRAQRLKKPRQFECYNCHELGHIARECPKAEKEAPKDLNEKGPEHK